MGVALIISRCGSSAPSALPRNASRCATPKRCCSSTMASASRAKRTFSEMTACVPTTSAASPLSTAAAIASRSRFFWLPVSQATRRPRSASSGSSQPTSLPKCCEARISVGAISAHWKPASMQRAAASAATSVLPEPTSPCSKRCIGCARARSPAISPSARRWAPVGVKGSTPSSCACSEPAPAGARRVGARCAARSRRACSCESCCASSSSAFSRCQAGWLWSSSVASATSGAG